MMFLSLSLDSTIEQTVSGNVWWPSVRTFVQGQVNGSTQTILYTGTNVVHYYVHECTETEQLGNGITAGYLFSSDQWPDGFAITSSTQVTVTLSQPPTTLSPGWGVADWFYYEYAAQVQGYAPPEYVAVAWAANSYFERISFNESRFLISRDRFLQNQKNHSLDRSFYFVEPEEDDGGPSGS